jgi:hypothetical protein
MGSVSPQQQAASAWFMGLERSQRPKTPGEVLKARQAEADARRAAAQRWIAETLPEFTDPTAGVCDFAVGIALRLRAEHPDLSPVDLAARVRVQREVWMRRCGAWDEATA